MPVLAPVVTTRGRVSESALVARGVSKRGFPVNHLESSRPEPDDLTVWTRRSESVFERIRWPRSCLPNRRRRSRNTAMNCSACCAILGSRCCSRARGFTKVRISRRRTRRLPATRSGANGRAELLGVRATRPKRTTPSSSGHREPIGRRIRIIGRGCADGDRPLPPARPLVFDPIDEHRADSRCQHEDRCGTNRVIGARSHQ